MRPLIAAVATLLTVTAGCVYDYAALSGHRGGGSGGGPPVTDIIGGAAPDAGLSEGGADRGTAAGQGNTGGGRADGGSSRAADASPQAGSGGAAGAPAPTVGGSGGAPGGQAGASLPGRGGGGGAIDGGGVAGGAVSVGGAGGSAAGGGPAVFDDVLDPVLWYRFDENSGTVDSDSSGYSTPPRNGSMVVTGSGAGATFSTVRRVGTHSLSLTGNGLLGGGYVTIPRVVDLAPQQLTISVWVYPLSNAVWQRVFDFGTGRTAYAFLTVFENLDSERHVRFAITTGGNIAEEVIDSSVVLTLNTWHHLVVVLEPGQPHTGTLYVDGKVSGTNPAMTLHFAELGDTTQNTLGKSAFGDAYLSGRLDDFRIYRRALTSADVAALFAAP